MYKKKINIGILGCSNIAKSSIIPTLREMKEFNVIGVASRTKKKADVFSQEFKLKSFNSYESILEEALIDAVYIPLPNSLHYQWAKKALE